MVYIANARIPTEKANGLQIMQNCEAFAQAGAEVRLWIPARRNTADLDGVDLFLHYGVERCFTIERLPCVDLMPLVPDRTDALAQAIFWVQWVTFTLAAFVRAFFARADVFYSRDALILLALSWVRSKRALAYEAHSMTRIGRTAARRVGAVVTTTGRLAEEMKAAGAARVTAAHDGIRAARFETLLDRSAARWAVGWETDAFVVGYVGRLHTMGMDKGVGRLVEALASRDGVALALVGGPDDMAAALRDRWIALGGREKDFLYAGQVAPERVAVYIRAFDICALPLPWTEHFAHYASPMKLFEYMAAGRPIIASDLPSAREVLTQGETALFFSPDDIRGIQTAVERLRSDPALRGELAAHGRALALEKYTWQARAEAILAFVEAE